MPITKAKSEKQKAKSTGGYTLIETLVAFVLLTVALTPALLLAVNSVNVGRSVQGSVIAANLAQEGIEVIRAIRDSNWFAGSVFDAGLAAGSYEIIWNSTPALTAWVNPGRFLYINNATGVYTYTVAGGTVTPYKRQITITKPSVVELKVVSTVTWPDRQRNRTISAESHLFDWK